MRGRHLATVCRKAAWNDGTSNSSTVSGRGVEAKAWLPARRTVTTSVQISSNSRRNGARIFDKCHQDLIEIGSCAAHQIVDANGAAVRKRKGKIGTRHQHDWFAGLRFTGKNCDIAVDQIEKFH